jgi:manganese/zinc/iron transport system permease protein
VTELPAWLRFLSLQDANVRYVLAGSILLGAGSAVLGCFAFLRKRALLGDALAHASLPGVCLAFMLFQSKNPLLLLVGAMVTGWMATESINFITSRSRVKEDTAIGLVLSVYFAAGIMLLTRIQQSGSASQAGLDKFLFGQAAAMIERDVVVLSGMAVVLIGAVFLTFKELKITAFDREYAETLGVKVKGVDFLMTMLIVLAVCVGLQAVGVVLMAAMLVTPAAAARYWTDRLSRMVVVAGIFGGLAGALGTFISFLAPRMPTGPWMVTAATAIFAVSLVAAPRRGMVARLLLRLRNRRKTNEENILTTLYRLGEERNDVASLSSLADMAGRRRMSPGHVARVLRRLQASGFAIPAPKGSDGMWRLTPPGLDRARRVIRLHRLWEIYLTERLHLASDHVHSDAEDVEHLITPEIEAELERILHRPARDPHGRQIPYPEPDGEVQP